MIATLGYAAKAAKEKLDLYHFQRRDVGDRDVLIEIKYCGICHSDVHQVRNEWGGSLFPMVPGHEIAGVVKEIGKKIAKFKVGDVVGVGCIVDSCRHCESCKEGLEQYCLDGMTPTYNGRERSGKQLTQGGYSNYIVVNEDYVLHMPPNLPLAAAAPLLCAGITLYSPLKHWHIGPGSKCAILGLGGLGHVGVKIAAALGAEVTVLSHTSKKEEDSKRLGAHFFYATEDKDVFIKLAKNFDFIICTVSFDIDWNQYLNLLKRDGKMILLGLPEHDVPINGGALIMQRRSLAGSLIGGIADTQEMLNFCGKHNIVADIELIPIQQVNIAYERMLKSDVRYRFVIDMASLTP